MTIMITDAPSYKGRIPQAVLQNTDTDKLQKYFAACQDCWAASLCAFLLMVCWAQRLVILCTDLLMFCVGSGRSPTSFVKARLSFAILSASMLCVRGARVKWKTSVHPLMKLYYRL